LRESIKIEDLNDQIQDTMLSYLLTMHNLSEGTKEQYLQRLRQFGKWLMENGHKSFEQVDKSTIDLFLSGHKNKGTINTYITVFKPFYSIFLNKPEPVSGLKFYIEDLQPITPSEVLSPDEVVRIAEECGKRKEIYKVLTLILFESCARISEVLNLKLGDVTFTSVLDKENHRKLIATLHFKRSKANVLKQPVTLVMFASELKRWCDNRSADGSQSWLFPSPYNSKKEPVSHHTVEYLLYEVAQRLGINKRVHPHWFRHSGLSYFANSKNYNEQLLMWRAGWKNTAMARRYIHSGAELEQKAYLEKMGYQVEQEKADKPILPKTCPHCNALNPYTNHNCDFCAMPLDLEKYKAEIEKRRDIEQLYQNVNQIGRGQLTKEQEAFLGERTETVIKLLEMGRGDLAKQYIEMLLGTWVKAFLTM
jgi:site-specific recombinase XerD